MNNKPRLLITGPLTGQFKGGLPTQGEMLGRLLADSGYPVGMVSGNPNRYIRLLEIVWKVFSRRNLYDVIVAQVFSGPAFVLTEAASRLGRLFGKKIIYVLRGGSLPNFSAAHSRWVRSVFARADRIITPSRYLESQLAWLGFPIQVIPNVLEIEEYPYRPRQEIQPRLFWMRSFHEIYNPHMAVRVLADLSRQYPHAVLTMAGPDRGQQASVEHLAQELGVSDRILFTGFLDDVGKRTQAQQNDIYLNTNRVDNMPVTVLEMAAFGLPLVAANVGGIPYLLQDGENALLVPDDDAGAMADAVRRLLTDLSLVECLTRNARSLAEASSWAEVSRLWDDVFQSL